MEEKSGCYFYFCVYIKKSVFSYLCECVCECVCVCMLAKSDLIVAIQTEIDRCSCSRWQNKNNPHVCNRLSPLSFSFPLSLFLSLSLFLYFQTQHMFAFLSVTWTITSPRLHRHPMKLMWTRMLMWASPFSLSVPMMGMKVGGMDKGVYKYMWMCF